MNSRKFHERVKRLFSFIHLRVKSGPLAGAKIILTTGKNFITGAYEPEKTQCIAEVTRPGMTIIDVGAHVGYYTMIMARKTGPYGKVFSFEPRDLNRNFLIKHLAINNFTNVEVFSQCVGDRAGRAMFEDRTGTGTGHLSDTGNVEVEMITIDEKVEEGSIGEPDLIKIDVEGAEMKVLTGACKTIERARPVMILAVHSDQIEKECRDFLEPMGYSFTNLGQSKGDREFLVKQGS